MGSNLTIDCDVFQTGVPVRMGSTQRCDLHRPQRLSIYILTRVVREGHEEPAFISPLTCCHFYQSLTYCISAVHNLVFLVFSGFSLGHQKVRFQQTFTLRPCALSFFILGFYFSFCCYDDDDFKMSLKHLRKCTYLKSPIFKKNNFNSPIK